MPHTRAANKDTHIWSLTHLSAGNINSTNSLEIIERNSRIGLSNWLNVEDELLTSCLIQRKREVCSQWVLIEYSHCLIRIRKACKYRGNAYSTNSCIIPTGSIRWNKNIFRFLGYTVNLVQLVRQLGFHSLLQSMTFANINLKKRLVSLSYFQDLSGR